MTASLVAPPSLIAVPLDHLSDPARLSADKWDAIVVVAPAATLSTTAGLSAALSSAIAAAQIADASLSKGARTAVVIPTSAAPGGRLVLGPTSALADDVDDVRAIAEATSAAVARAVEAGAQRPLLLIATSTSPTAGKSSGKFVHAHEVAALAAVGSQWHPLEGREAGKAPAGAQAIGMLGIDEAQARTLVAVALGKHLARDICGTEPERMAPRRVAALCKEAFAHDEKNGGAHVEVRIEEDVARYPLLAAVGRASMVTERHKPCVIRLDYTPPGTIERTIVLCGKGVTYDTGGADLKTDGHMAGMSRDKGGAAAVAGLLRAIALQKTPGVRVVGLLGMVRNSVGEESFVSDEIIAARSGVRVRIGNTDAEGRLVLADLAAAAKEIVGSDTSALILSVATLTGHVYRAYGPYGGLIGNAAAHARGDIDRIDALGEVWGEPFERSRLRREDYAMVAGRSCAEDVVSCNRLASVNTPRGHQFPFAFLDVVSGLRGTSIPFIHLDIGGVAVEPADWQFGKPTGNPISTLSAMLNDASSRR